MKSRGKSRFVLATVVLSFAAAGLSAPAAQAYVHNWGFSYTGICNPLWPDTRCTDNAGQTYNPWLYVAGGYDGPATSSEVCVKAVTSAGNLRSTVNGNDQPWDYCMFSGYRTVGITLSASTPDSKAYGYFNNPPGPATIARYYNGRAQTP